MLSFFLSTVVFFVAAYYLNDYLDDQGMEHNMSRKMLVGTIATVISFGAGWIIDKVVDGDTPSSGLSVTRMATSMQSGDPAQLMKAVSGIK
jgi:hypothetical protein